LQMSPFGPKRTSCHGANARICVGLSIVVKPPGGGDMQRRGESGQPAKGQRQRTRPKARKVPTAHVSTDHSADQFDRLKRERYEAVEQQAATSEVLKVISRSPGELQPVFEAILANATRICEAKFGTLFRFDGENFHPVAQFNTPTALLEAQTRRGPFQPPS